MTVQAEATYENGMLRLSAPLPLPEHARVTLTIQSAGEAAPTPEPSDWVKHVRALAASAPKVSHVIDDSRESFYGPPEEPPLETLPQDEWTRKFHAWADSFPTRARLADDSRESISP